MPERDLVIEKAKVGYEGLFEIKPFWNLFADWSKDKGYYLLERKHTESVRPEGKTVDIQFRLIKKLTDYAKSVINITIRMNKVKDKVVTKDKKKKKFQQGAVTVTVDGILETDYERKWEVKPVFYVIRAMFERYVYSPYVKGFKQGINEDTNNLLENVKAFLNLYKL